VYSGAHPIINGVIHGDDSSLLMQRNRRQEPPSPDGDFIDIAALSCRGGLSAPESAASLHVGLGLHCDVSFRKIESVSEEI
jgi:hypothetical protein